MNIDLDKIEFKIKIIDEGKMKAIIGLDFGDFVIRGFRIQESKFPNKNGDMLWFTPPTYLGGGRHHPIFFVPNKDLWLQIEDKIWPAYKEKLDDHYKKKFGIKDIDPFHS